MAARATAAPTAGRHLKVVRPVPRAAAREEALEKARRARRQLERASEQDRFAYLRRSHD